MKSALRNRWIPTLMIAGLAALIVWPLGAAATTRIWTGAGSDALASTAANWSDTTAPVTGDHVRFGDAHLGNVQTNTVWDLDIHPASWTQTVAYVGTVTIQTKYPGQGTFTNLTITGDVSIEGGVWTHENNPQYNDTQVNRLAVSIGGDFVLGVNTVVNAQGKGHRPGYGPGRGGSSNNWGQRGASHGGLSAPHPTPSDYYRTYGSIHEPIHLGSGALNYGGGAVLIRVGGTTLVEGTIRADGFSTSLSGSAGGSVWLITGALEGGGLINASAGASGDYGGGGGRISLIVTNGTSFGSVLMRAYGSGGRRGAAGTIYLETKDQAPGTGTLKIDNGDVSGWAQTLMKPEDNDLNVFSEIIVTNRGVLGLNTNTVWNLGNPVNLVTYGPAQSFVATAQTNGLSLPADWTLSGYELRLSTNAMFAGLTVSNAALRLLATNVQPSLAVAGDLLMADNGVLSASGLAVGNDLTIEAGGVLTHQPFDEAYRLILTVGNNLVIHAGGRLHADGAGFSRGQGPGCGSSANSNTKPAASHGGQGTPNPGIAGQPVTYGSILQPTRFGSGAYAYGGGAIQATVDGTTVLNGEITARPVGGLADGAGGSILLTTGYLEGSGQIIAQAQIRSASTVQHSGGGGRIAVYVMKGTDTDGVTMDAMGGRCMHPNRPPPGAAGTRYIETAAHRSGWGTIRVDNYHTTWGSDLIQSSTNIATQLPAATEWEDEDLSWTQLDIDRMARVSLTSDLTLRDLYILHADARLHLNGYTLRLRSPYHDDWGSELNVVYDGGEIIWTLRGSLIEFR